MAKAAKRKRWQFLWCDRQSEPRNGDDHHWKTKIFRVATFEKAMDLMLEFIKAQGAAEPAIDYECCAAHVTSGPHDECFPRIDCTEHPLKEYVD